MCDEPAQPSIDEAKTFNSQRWLALVLGPMFAGCYRISLQRYVTHLLQLDRAGPVAH